MTKKTHPFIVSIIPGDLVLPPEEILRPFFDPKETVCLRVFSDKPDSVLSFVEERCALEPDASIYRTALYDDY